MSLNERLITYITIDTDNITILVISLCVALFVFPLIPWFKRLQGISPGLMISIGILGTFWGTLIALNGFDTGSVDSNGDRTILDHSAMVESIPQVLAGMKSAFITSLIGLFFAFIAKLAYPYLQIKESDKIDEAKLPPLEKEYLKLFQSIKDAINGEKENSLYMQLNRMQLANRDNSKEIKDIISGEGESSIVAQLTLLRNESSTGLSNIHRQMEGLDTAIRESLLESLNALAAEIRTVIAEQLVAQLTETNEILRERLEEMIRRIEEVLLDSFLTSFREFNEAVQAIKIWQEEHKQHVEQLTEAFNTCANGIETIRSDCQSIPESMKELNQIMGELNERLQAFAEMKQQAVESFPVIKEHLEKIGKDLEESASGFNGLGEVITSLQTKSDQLVTEHFKHVSGLIKEAGDNFAQMTREIADESKNLTNEQRQRIVELSDQISESIRDNLTQATVGLNELAEGHAAAIDGVIKDITQKWGDNVVSIAEHVAAGTRQ